MPSMNQVVLVGRLTRDPEARPVGEAGRSITKFGLAVDRMTKDKDGNKVTDFFDCSAFGPTADMVMNYLTKGRLVGVSGRINVNKVTDDSGNTKSYVDIIANTVDFLDSKPEATTASA